MRLVLILAALAMLLCPTTYAYTWNSGTSMTYDSDYAQYTTIQVREWVPPMQRSQYCPAQAIGGVMYPAHIERWVEPGYWTIRTRQIRVGVYYPYYGF